MEIKVKHIAVLIIVILALLSPITMGEEVTVMGVISLVAVVIMAIWGLIIVISWLNYNWDKSFKIGKK